MAQTSTSNVIREQQSAIDSSLAGVDLSHLQGARPEATEVNEVQEAPQAAQPIASIPARPVVQSAAAAPVQPIQQQAQTPTTTSVMMQPVQQQTASSVISQIPMRNEAMTSAISDIADEAVGTTVSDNSIEVDEEITAPVEQARNVPTSPKQNNKTTSVLSSIPQRGQELLSIQQERAKVEKPSQPKKHAEKEGSWENGVHVRTNAPRRYSDLPDESFSEASSMMEEQARASSAQKSVYEGRAISGKALSDPTLLPHEVGLGTEDIEQLMRIPDNWLSKLIAETTGEIVDETTSIETIKEILNDRSREVYVLTTKMPITENGSHMLRVLRVVDGRGVFVHPTQAKLYNADFDGDTISITFDMSEKKNVFKALEYLIDMNGNVLIDSDYFPIDPLSDLDTLVKTMRSKESLNSLSTENIKKVAEALYKLSQDQTNENWYNFIASIQEVGYLYDNSIYAMSQLLKTTYDIMSNVRQLSYSHLALDNPIGEYGDSDSIDARIMEVTEQIAQEMSVGQAPPNFQDYLISLGIATGKSKDLSNIYFRTTTDPVKGINRNPEAIVGEAGLYDLYSRTIRAAVSLQASDKVFFGDNRKLVENRVIQEQCRKNVGLPSDPRYNGNFTAFLKRFIDVYNSEVLQINLAKETRLTDMSMDRSAATIDEIDKDSLSRLAGAFIRVYGIYNMDVLFKGITFSDSEIQYGEHFNPINLPGFLAEKYKDMPLERFVQTNHLRISAREVDKTTYEKKFEELKEIDFIELLAQERSAFNSRFNKKYNELLDQHRDVLHQLKQIIESDRVDYQAWAKELSNLLYISGKEMFNYYGMISPKKFLASKWGQTLLQCKTADELGGVRDAMHYEFRMRKYSNVIQKITRVASREITKRFTNEDRKVIIEELNAAAATELDILSSSSIAWEAIINERRNRNQAFITLVNQFNQIEGFHPNASMFWQSEKAKKLADPARKTNVGIDAVMRDPSIDHAEKMNILCDVVRISESFYNIGSFEMVAQLYYDPDKAYAGNPYDNVATPRNDLDQINASLDRCASYSKHDIDKIMDNCERLLSECQNPGELDATLKYLDSDPFNLVNIDNGFYADALCTALDKESKDSEKSKQQNAIIALFEGLGFQLNGGKYSDLYRSDNRVLGKIGINQITFKDFIHILANPSYKITVYDGFGNEEEISRARICGDNSEASLKQLLRENPRIAAMIRQHHVTATSEANTTAFLAASCSSQETAIRAKTIENPVTTCRNNIKSMVFDRPEFGAILALLHETHKASSRYLRGQYEEHIESLLDLLITHAHKKRNANGFRAGKAFLNHFGLTQVDVQKKGLSKKEAKELLTELDSKWSSMVEAAYKMIPEDLPLSTTTPKWTGSFDRQSISAYYDVFQMLSGAKTASMVGVEGSESYKNGLMCIYTGSIKDRYLELLPDTSAEDQAKMTGWMTNAGYAIGEKSFDELINLANGELVVILPDGFSVSEELEDFRPVSDTQINGISRQLMIKRNDGAEAFNLKVKKLSDDGTSSIVKHLKYAYKVYGENGSIEIIPADENAKKRVIPNVESAYTRGGKFAAVCELAKHLRWADNNIGYNDMSLSDYMNIAEIMIAERTPGDTSNGIVIRSIEQLSYCVNQQFPLELAGCNDIERIQAAIKDIIDRVGIDNQGIDIIHTMNMQKVRSNAPIKYVRRRRSSSVDRNYAELKNILKEVGKEKGFKILSSKDVAYRVNEMADKYPSIVNKVKGFAYPRDEWTNGERSLAKYNNQTKKYVYDLIGVINKNGKDVQRNIGGQNVWFIDKEANINDIQWALSQAKKYGITIMFDDPSSLDEKSRKTYIKDIIPVKTEDDEVKYIIPFFDIRLNGGTAFNCQSVPGVGVVDDDQIVYITEEYNNEHKLGDSMAVATRNFLKRVTINRNRPAEIDKWSLFHDALQNNPNQESKLRLASSEEIERFIINQPYDSITNIDFGMNVDNANFDKEDAKMKLRVEEYRDRWLRNDVIFDENGKVTGGLAKGKILADQIVGWAALETESGICFAPIIPLMYGGTSGIAAKFEVENFYADDKTSRIHLDWKFSASGIEGLRNQWFKFHEGFAAANKLMVFGDPIDDVMLEDGSFIDVIFPKATTASRRLGINARMQTLTTMWFSARGPMHGYNFADIEGAFPNDENLRNDLLTERQPMSYWSSLKVDEIVFHKDPKLNAFVKKMIRKCLDTGVINPSDFLASRWIDNVDEEGARTWKRYRIAWEYEILMDTTLGFQQAMMRYFNAVIPNFCTQTLREDDPGRNTALFVPCLDKDSNNFGCMQMRVKHTDPNGKEYSLFQNVYASPSFIGKDFSGFSRPSIDATSYSLDAINVMIQTGRVPSDFNLKNFIKWCTSDRAPELPKNNKIIFENDDWMDIPVRNRNKFNGLTISFTGRRPKDLFGYEEKEPYVKLKNRIEEVVKYSMEQTGDKDVQLISGGAQGVDQLAFWAGESLKSSGVNVNNTLHIPDKKQASRWAEEGMFGQNEYNSIIDRADEVYDISEIAYSDNYNSLLSARNRTMMEDADFVIAVHQLPFNFNKDRGGTAQAVRKAVSMGKQVICIDPNTLQVVELYGGSTIPLIDVSGLANSQKQNSEEGSQE